MNDALARHLEALDCLLQQQAFGTAPNECLALYRQHAKQIVAARLEQFYKQFNAEKERFDAQAEAFLEQIRVYAALKSSLSDK